MSDTGSTGPGSSSSDPGNFEALEQRLLQSPTARARFLADTLELLEKNGVDVNSPDFQQQIQPSLDLTEGSRFLGGLAASTVVVAIATAGQRGSIASQAGNAASTVVVVAASAGQRGSIGSDLGRAASSVVIVAASAGQRGSIGSDLGRAASTVVIVAASAGQRGSIGSDLGRAASTVVVAVATAGQRGLGGMLGRQESTQGGVQGSVQGGFTVTVPAAATIADVARGLRALADLLVNESEALDQQIQQLAAASGGTRGSESGT
ncbi:hypothetical protein MVG78_11180 [Roseomonas gilardii subsp. gilardii]|uniref:hypothetical protein n=1 Tax=Roseomonas gilardii TaxID=257708 RepID=UPI001FF98E31|nr:hypothetical protein [Roseomonas gilardii]UPG71167.1 hypothetical protein MVG78_11180 [Roseomonas gilardii subsp. gilardii]